MQPWVWFIICCLLLFDCSWSWKQRKWIRDGDMILCICLEKLLKKWEKGIEITLNFKRFIENTLNFNFYSILKLLFYKYDNQF